MKRDKQSTVSIAGSLKRIADAMESKDEPEADPEGALADKKDA